MSKEGIGIFITRLSN